MNGVEEGGGVIGSNELHRFLGNPAFLAGLVATPDPAVQRFQTFEGVVGFCGEFLSRVVGGGYGGPFGGLFEENFRRPTLVAAGGFAPDPAREFIVCAASGHGFACAEPDRIGSRVFVRFDNWTVPWPAEYRQQECEAGPVCFRRVSPPVSPAFDRAEEMGQECLFVFGVETSFALAAFAARPLGHEGPWFEAHPNSEFLNMTLVYDPGCVFRKAVRQAVPFPVCAVTDVEFFAINEQRYSRP